MTQATQPQMSPEQKAQAIAQQIRNVPGADAVLDTQKVASADFAEKALSLLQGI